MATGKEIDVVVITPERQVLAEIADQVIIPAHDGELGVLDHRAPLMCELGIGQLRYYRNGVPTRVFIDGGFAQVLENRVTVLTGRAMRADDVTAEVVKEAQREVDAHQGTEPDTRSARERAQRRLSVLRGMQVSR